MVTAPLDHFYEMGFKPLQALDKIGLKLKKAQLGLTQHWCVYVYNVCMYVCMYVCMCMYAVCIFHIIKVNIKIAIKTLNCY